ncbi:MAG: hypothetical protein J6V22_05660 [Clostridia bacterium]|nr:hypothetical protein [Clostridia bacterium]
MKKLLIFLLLATMVLSFVACKENDTSEPETKTYTFTSGTTKIAIDADAAPILASLGEWRDYAESTSCAFEGLDKVYIYAGFELQTYPMGEKDYVYMIILQDDTVATEKGIRIGAAKAVVITAYGTPNQESATSLTYNADGMYLQFILRDGVVTSIQYSKAQ